MSEDGTTGKKYGELPDRVHCEDYCMGAGTVGNSQRIYKGEDTGEKQDCCTTLPYELQSKQGRQCEQGPGGLPVQLQGVHQNSVLHKVSQL